MADGGTGLGLSGGLAAGGSVLAEIFVIQDRVIRASGAQVAADACGFFWLDL